MQEQASEADVGNAAEPVVVAPVDKPVELVADGEENLPPVPAGVVAAQAAAPVAAEGNVIKPEDLARAESTGQAEQEALSEESLAEEPLEESAEEEALAPTLRYLGAEGPELDFIEPEGELTTFGDVLIQLVDTALDHEGKGSGEQMTGEAVAQIFCRGDVQDDRVTFLLLLLAQNRPVTAEMVLAAARSLGHEELVEQATISREELARAGDVSVEELTLAGTFAVPSASAMSGAEVGA
jgi:hypothetical protein